MSLTLAEVWGGVFEEALSACRALPRVEAPPLHVLVVEDDDAQVDALERAVRRLGIRCDVHRARTLHAASRLAPGADLVLLDLSLPDSGPDGTVQALRAFAPRVPLVVVTAWPDVDVAGEVCVAKPWTIRALLDGIQRAAGAALLARHAA